MKFTTQAKIELVHDGDTCTGICLLPFGITVPATFRLNGINAPELTGPRRMEADGAEFPIIAHPQSDVGS